MGCCDGRENVPQDVSERDEQTQETRDTVREGYARIAEAGSLEAAAGGCCGAGEGDASAEALAQQIGYTVEVEAYERMMREAGFRDVQLTPNPDYVDALAQWKSSLHEKIAAHLPAGAQLRDHVTSLNAQACRA